MAKATDAQREQRAQAWALFQIGAALGNLSQLRKSYLPEEAQANLHRAKANLQEAQEHIRLQVAATALQRKLNK